MIRCVLVVFLVAATVGTADAARQLYRQDEDTIASYNYDTFADFQGKPSVWVRWHYSVPRDGMAGKRIHCMADCGARKLYEIYEHPYGPGGMHLDPVRNVDAPKESSGPKEARDALLRVPADSTTGDREENLCSSWYHANPEELEENRPH